MTLMFKYLRLLMLSSLLLVGMSACTTITPGHAGIVVNNLGKDKGVKDIPITTGFQLYNPLTTDIFIYPTSVQTAVWTHDVTEGHPANEEITFTTKDNMVVHVDASVSYQLISDSVPHFYVKFRTDDLNTFTHGFLRNTTRNAFDEIASAFTVDLIMGDNAAFIKAVRDKVQSEVAPIGVDIVQFGIIGAPRPPQQVIDSINAKVQATQIAIQKENEVRQANADAQKSIAYAKGQAESAIETARGEAEANRIKLMSITPTILAWRALDIQEQAISKWNGAQPQIVTGNGSTLLQLPSVGK